MYVYCNLFTVIFLLSTTKLLFFVPYLLLYAYFLEKKYTNSEKATAYLYKHSKDDPLFDLLLTA